MKEENAEYRINKAKIKIQQKNPFFAYLCLYLKMKEDKKIETMGVDIKANCHYNPEFVDKMNDEEIQAVLLHEVLHLALLHLIRGKNKNHQIYNISSDICINIIIEENGFRLPKDVLRTDSNYTFEHKGDDGTIIKVENCNEKTADVIYDEIYSQLSKQGKANSYKYEFDKHEYSDGQGKDEEGKDVDYSNYWTNKTHEATQIAKMRGEIPKGVGRLVSGLHEEKIDWKSLLNRFITKSIPYNQSYRLPHKRSISIGEYMPHIEKENIEIAIGLDLSGSISEKELGDFLSEVIGIARAYQERITMTVFSHDTEGYNCGTIRNGNIEKIKKLELKGSGGTSHKDIMDKIKKDISDCKCAIFFTDGYSDLDTINFEEYNYSKLFIINGGGTEEQLKDKQCEVVKIEADTYNDN